MENFGDWSGGKHEVNLTFALSNSICRWFSPAIKSLLLILFVFQDKRLAGGYENVPTDDIHMNQVSCHVSVNNTRPSLSPEEIRVTTTESSKTCSRWKARETRVSHVTIGFGFASDWLKKTASFLWLAGELDVINITVGSRVYSSEVHSSYGLSFSCNDNFCKSVQDREFICLSRYIL